MFGSARSLAAGIVLATASASASHAQQVGAPMQPSTQSAARAPFMPAPALAAPLAPVGDGTTTGPTLTRATVALRSLAEAPAPADSAAARAALQRASGLGQNEILMIIGGATFLTGAIIGGDAGTIIMIGGAGVGLYGLYRYLQQ